MLRGEIFASPPIHVEALTPNVVFGGEAFGRKFGLDEVIRVGPF